MRGTRYLVLAKKNDGRNTPAYAGNTNGWNGLRNRKEEHPRVCGEHSLCPSSTCTFIGTPPRMRGTHLFHTLLAIPPRNTPAYAGNTVVILQDGKCIQEHPRVCGEHGICHKMNYPSMGTPPRMRGTRFDFYWPALANRNTPAYAGNTPFKSLLIGVLWEHPRVCGEHLFCHLAIFRVQGTPPRMRGTR